jgi:hypothetical protein
LLTWLSFSKIGAARHGTGTTQQTLLARPNLSKASAARHGTSAA